MTGGRVLRLSKELQHKDQIIESLHTQLQQRPDMPCSSHAPSETTDQSDGISFASDERGSTNEDVDLCSDMDTTSEFPQEEPRPKDRGAKTTIAHTHKHTHTLRHTHTQTHTHTYVLSFIHNLQTPVVWAEVNVVCLFSNSSQRSSLAPQLSADCACHRLHARIPSCTGKQRRTIGADRCIVGHGEYDSAN